MEDSMHISDFMEDINGGPVGKDDFPDPFEDTGTENLPRVRFDNAGIQRALQGATRVHSRIAQPIALPSRAVLASLINEALEVWILDAANLGDNNAGVSIADYIIKELS
jgi:hypothetical protein